MRNGTTTAEPPVARHKPKPQPEEPEGDSERIEFQAPPGFTAKVDAAARKASMSRSAYIRNACLKQIKRDRSELGEEDEE